MENDIGILWIAIVRMAIPVRGAKMNLNTSGPHSATNANFGIEEVWAFIAVMKSRVDNLNFLSIRCSQISKGE